MSGDIVVVTGGAGFIGSHLAEALRTQGRRVRVVDDFSTGRRASVPPGVELLEGDANDQSAEAVRDAAEVYHLAAIPSVPGSVERPLANHRATAQAALSMLAAAERAGVRRVVLASSSAVYGDAAALPLREEAAPRPGSPYAAAKLAAEQYAASWASRGGLEAVSLRFFNVYGPRQDPDSPYAAVIPVFARRIRDGKPMPVYGDGGQTRDFIFVGDVVRALLLAGSVPGVSGRVYNVACGAPVSVLEVGRTLASLMGKPPEFEFLPPRPGDVRDSVADVSAARRDLGFSAAVPLDEGLRRTVAEWVPA
jgi:UDP-glucose 4-epimerase